MDNEGLRSVLREELENVLHGVRSDIQKLQCDMAYAVTRIATLERSTSPWPSPRNALRPSSSAGSSEPPRKNSRSSVGFSPRATSDDAPISSDTFILNSFPAKTSRDDVKQWITPIITQLVGETEFFLTSRSKYDTRFFLRFTSVMRAKAFSLAWRKETRAYPVQGAEPVRIFIHWKLSPMRAKEVFKKSSSFASSSSTPETCYDLLLLDLRRRRSRAQCAMIRSSSRRLRMRSWSLPRRARAMRTLKSFTCGLRRRRIRSSLFSAYTELEATELRLALLAELGPICSWNARGLFAAAPALRRSKLQVANALGLQANIVVLQETHGEASDWATSLLPTFHKFVSPHQSSRGKAGVIIAVHAEGLLGRTAL